MYAQSLERKKEINSAIFYLLYRPCWNSGFLLRWALNTDENWTESSYLTSIGRRSKRDLLENTRTCALYIKTEKECARHTPFAIIKHRTWKGVRNYVPEKSTLEAHAMRACIQRSRRLNTHHMTCLTFFFLHVVSLMKYLIRYKQTQSCFSECTGLSGKQRLD